MCSCPCYPGFLAHNSENSVYGQIEFEGGLLSAETDRHLASFAKELAGKKGIDLGTNFKDCGLIIFNPNEQDVHSGGSGCGCVASVFSSYLMSKIADGSVQKLLLVGTGALFSPVSTMQGENIPSIGHAVSISVN